MSHDLAIARASRMRLIADVAEAAGIPLDALDFQGKHIAKLERSFLHSLTGRPDGKLVLVTAINPTPAGEGKTTTTIGLGDALNRIGKKAVIARSARSFMSRTRRQTMRRVSIASALPQ